MMAPLPTCYKLVSGHSEGFMPLNAVDGALLAAGIGDTNLVRLSSILPPGCVYDEGIVVPPGSLLPTAYAVLASASPGELLAAAIAIAIPMDETLPGLIMEYSAKVPVDEAEATVRRMAEEGFQMRERRLREVRSVAVGHRVERTGAVFAAVVLWY